MSIYIEFVCFVRSTDVFSLIFLNDLTLSDSFMSAERLFHSRIVFGKKDFEKIALCIKGTRS